MLFQDRVAATLVDSQHLGQVARCASDALRVGRSVAARRRHCQLLVRRHRRVADPEDTRPVSITVGAAAVKLGVHLVDSFT